jgi:hypothetical protein
MESYEISPFARVSHYPTETQFDFRNSRTESPAKTNTRFTLTLQSVKEEDPKPFYNFIKKLSESIKILKPKGI